MPRQFSVVAAGYRVNGVGKRHSALVHARKVAEEVGQGNLYASYPHALPRKKHGIGRKRDKEREHDKIVDVCRGKGLRYAAFRDRPQYACDEDG